MPILLWFLLLPILEIVGFIQVGDWIGAGPTIGLLLLSAVIGVLLIRHRGLASLSRVQGAALQGDAALSGLLDGVCVVIAGILLIIPGFLSDLVALVLLIPPLRRGMGRWLVGRLAAGNAFQVFGSTRFSQTPGGFSPGSGAGSGPAGQPFRAQPGVIDGDFQEISDPTPGDAPGTPRLSDSQWGNQRPDRRD
ncbi:FxsA family protein [Azospirillum sp.]|uniref:FxsA family protein n=1 Tax=Azospirillum sp. TaxID=34012 RepID=UPI0026052D3C|nr:FxsA family protein [Azospirillum sp.]